MIKNERQYRISKAQVERFISQLILLNNKAKDLDPILFQAEKDAIESQIEEMQKDIEEYEQLQQSKGLPLIELHSIEELSQALIKTRIALRLSQKDLANLVGVKEQQIQRWEATDYLTTNLSRIKDIIKALNIVIPERLHLPREIILMSKFFKKMEKVGLDKTFIVKRLLPPLLASYYEDKNENIAPVLLGLQTANIIGKIFHWTTDEILSDTPLQLNTSLIPEVHHKLPKMRNELKVNAYTIYSHYIARLMIKTTENIAQKPLPNDPYEIHKTILSRYNSLKLENTIRYVWELGIPIIALSDPGLFHAACFHIRNRNVIILKQKTLSEARWMFDLFHEFWHATQDHGCILYITSESSVSPNKMEDTTANQFAAAVLLGKNPQNLAEMCIKESHGELRRMKEAIRIVSEKEDVRADVIANYIAFRLQYEGDNRMWGIAENLQEKTIVDPRIIIKNIIFEYSDLGALSTPDLELLRRALIDEGDSTNG